MTVQCIAPDSSLGVALRLAGYLECQSRALGENGFQALAGGPAMTAILSGAITIFVALIGYRMILGSVPGIRDGIGWAIRLGIVLTLVTSWPAFQTLVYRVVTDGPQELATLVLPATGLPAEALDDRLQEAYDAIRKGGSASGLTQPQIGNPQLQRAPPSTQQLPPALVQLSTNIPPLPQTASFFVMSTSGLIGALRMVVGFLIAIGPLAIICLLFRGTVGIFDGWIRAVVGAAFGVFATTIVTAMELIVVESEIAHERAAQLSADAASSLDPQALVTIILVFVMVAIAVLFASVRVAGAFRLPGFGDFTGFGSGKSSPSPSLKNNPTENPPRLARGASRDGPVKARTMAVADALTAAAYRDRATLGRGDAEERSTRTMTIRQQDAGTAAVPVVPLGVAGRRSTGRRTQSAKRRDTLA